MFNIIPAPVKLMGSLAASGLALWGGWTLGSYLGEVALGEKEPPWRKLRDFFEGEGIDEALLKRKFSPVSDE